MTVQLPIVVGIETPLRSQTKDQFVIGRYHNGTQHPAQRFIGSGPAILTGTANTKNLAIPAVAVTEDYNEAIAQWQGGSTSGAVTHPAVLQPLVRDITIAGHDETGSDYASGSSNIASTPGNNVGNPDLHHGLLARCSGGEFSKLKLFYIPGTAASFSRPFNPRLGQLRLHDYLDVLAERLFALRCYRGIEFLATDSTITKCDAHSCRDYGIKIGNAVKANQLHTWGIHDIGVWLSSTTCEGRDFYVENCQRGLVIDGDRNQVDIIRSFACTVSNIEINGRRNVLSKIEIASNTATENALIGVHLKNSFNTLLGGRIVAKAGGTCIRIENGDNQIIRDLRLDCPNTTDSFGIVAAGGSVATLNNCVIDVHLANGLVGLKLVESGTSRLGVRNFIRVSTRTASEPATAIELPATWDSSNEIILNGVKLTP